MKQPNNFGALPDKFCCEKDAGIAIVPVPYDQTCTWIKGADKGPSAIIKASANMELYDIETDSEVYRKGIFTELPLSKLNGPEEVVEAVSQAVQRHIDNGRFTVVIGGEHSVSIGAIWAHAGNYKNVTVLQLDAHADLRDEYNGSRYNHACVMARAKEFAPIVQVGIRSMDISEKAVIDMEKTFLVRDIIDSNSWVKAVISNLSDNVYVTIDLDVFDPSIMSSTGTPEPGGLLWYDVLALLKAVCAKRNVIGFDVVELCPKPDNNAPDFLAARLIYKLLSYRFGEQNG